MSNKSTVIHVHSQVDSNSMPFLLFMWNSALQLANKPDLLMLTIHCLGDQSARHMNENIISNNMKNVKVVEVPHGAGSVGHSLGTDSALKMTSNGDINIIVDADTTVVAKGWDDYVRLTVDRGVGCAGPAYLSFDDTNELAKLHNSPLSLTHSYFNTPNLIWMILSPNYDFTNLQTVPQKQFHPEINTQELSQVYNIPIGYKLLRDVGWQIPEYLANNKIPFESWYLYKSWKPGAIVINGLADYHEEYQVEGIPFVLHHRGGSRHRFKSPGMSETFFARVEPYIEEAKRLEPRWTY